MNIKTTKIFVHTKIFEHTKIFVKSMNFFISQEQIEPKNVHWYK